MSTRMEAEGFLRRLTYMQITKYIQEAKGVSWKFGAEFTRPILELGFN